MKTPARIAVSLPVAVALWAAVAWPLPRHLFSGIPSSAHNIETPAVRRMIPGDHLQLLYHFQLLPEALAGRIPWFRNPYEFNRGDDDRLVHRGFYYLPFSAVYAAGSRLGGRAFGWNLAGFGAVWLGFLGCLLLARRYNRRDEIAFAAAAAACLIPYGWSAFMGGSPTGFGMALAPWFLLGMDTIVRDGGMRGGWLAGAALLASCWSDTHVFFFVVLAAPAWAAVALAMRPPAAWRDPQAWTRIFRAALPLAVFAALTLASTIFMKSGMRESQMAGGRSIQETLIFSPHWQGFFRTGIDGMSVPIFIGRGLPFGMAAAWLAAALLLVRDLFRRNPPDCSLRAWIVLSLLAAGILIVMILALGPRGPMHGRVFGWARRLIPPYRMIRQPAKVMLLLPAFTAVALAMGAGALERLCKRGRLVAGVTAALVFGVAAVETAPYVRPTICLPRDEQPAYAAVAAHAAGREILPRAVILPLWPGDSHYGSVYQHYVSLYSIRMLNGYSPVVSRAYFDEVFLRFQSLNQGALDNGRIDALRAMGIEYLLLHEDLFPERVSPFPVVRTLEALLRHPRLQFLGQGGSVWAFHLRDAPAVSPDGGPPIPADWNLFFPSRHWEIEHFAGTAGVRAQYPDASGGAAVTLDGPTPPFGLRPTGAPPAEGLKLLARLRGRGLLRMAVGDGETAELLDETLISVAAPDWEWREAPIPLDRFRILAPVFEVLEGRVELDSALLMAGDLPAPLPGEKVALPAPLFFRAGHTDIAGNSVMLSAADDPQGVIFYGPLLPLPAGRYAVTVDFAAEGTEPAGSFHLRCGAFVSDVKVLKAGRAAVLETDIPYSLPVRLNLDFHRKADLKIRRVEFLRLE